jgi:hypothetical protein
MNISVKKADGTVAREIFVGMRDYGDSLGVVLLNTNRNLESGDLTLEIDTDEYKFAELWSFDDGSRADASSMVRVSDGTLIINTKLLPAETQAFVLTRERDDTLKPLPEG